MAWKKRIRRRRMAPEDEAASWFLRKVIIPSITGLISLTVELIKKIPSLISNKPKKISNEATHIEYISNVQENKNINGFSVNNNKKFYEKDESLSIFSQLIVRSDGISSSVAQHDDVRNSIYKKLKSQNQVAYLSYDVQYGSEGRRGYVDVVLKSEYGLIGVEVDRTSPKPRSISKLRQFDIAVFVLRARLTERTKATTTNRLSGFDRPYILIFLPDNIFINRLPSSFDYISSLFRSWMAEYYNGTYRKFGEVVPKVLISGKRKDIYNNNYLASEIKSKSDFDPILLKKGEEFEDFVITLFNEYFEIMPRTEAYPDYKIKFNPTREIFAIECKWRKSLSENAFIIDDRQLQIYKNYKINKNIPFFMVLGLGGYPSEPYKIFIIPLDRIDHSEIKYEYLSRFEKNIPNKPFYFNTETKQLS